MGRERRLKMWARIEAEFNEPVRDVIVGLREQGNSWRTVAGALGTTLGTLQEWRKELGLPLDSSIQIYDPSSLPEYTPTDILARELGYKDATEAVLNMRLKQKLTLEQAAEKLGVCVCTVLRYTPKKVRGSIYNRSENWWRVRRAQVVEMTKKWKAKYSGKGRSIHPFDRDDDILFAKKHGR